MSRLRVLIVAPSLDILGGQAVQAARLLANLRREPDLEVDLLPVNPRLPGPFRALQRIKYVRTAVTSIAYFLSLLRRAPRYHVVHIFSASYWSFLLAPVPALLAARLYGKPSILNYRSGEAEDHLARWRTAVPSLRLASAIAVPSGYLVDVFGRFGLSARSIPNVVDTSRFTYRRREPLHPVFLSNRNFEALYNVGCVLRAFAVIQARLPEARLILAGDGAQRSELEGLARDLNLRQLTFTGRVPPERMPALYDEADVYLNAPDIDNMPASILEAYACGLPVITTGAGGIPYMVRHNQTGLIVSRGDFAAMAVQALRLFEEPGLARSLADSAKCECERYTWTAVRGQWLNLYFEMDHLHNRDGKRAGQTVSAGQHRASR